VSSECAENCTIVKRVIKLRYKSNVEFLEQLSVPGYYVHRLISRWTDGSIDTEKVY
jgi:hypothetical protein